jgi:hypothetical protein
MFFTVIDTESLIDPRIINSFKPFKVEIEYEPNSQANKYHHVFFLGLDEENLEKQIELFSQQMKDGWYAFFWNQEIFYIVFNKQRFLVKLPDPEKDENYIKAQNYGKSVEIQENFLNFKEYWERYNRIALENYKH